MPGGGLYKRVEKATLTARNGPDHLLQHNVQDQPIIKSSLGASLAEPALDAAAPQEVCDVQAFTVWYWTNGPEPSFVPETMYMNSKEMGHKTGEPRLIVSLSSFEALSQAYVMSVEKEGVKAALLQEKEDLLQEVRKGYYKELQHLRELLDMAKEQMMLARGINRLEESDRKRMEEFEREVRETDVHYFNIVEYLEPELKEIMKDAVKQFHRHLMLENFNLRDRLALHEGTDGDEGLAERLITLLMGKGTTPAEIVKILSGMITDRQQSDDFMDACRQILGISKTPLEREEFQKNVRSKTPQETEKPLVRKRELQQQVNGEEKEVVEVDHTQERALMKEADRLRAEAQEAKEEADRLRAELEAMRKKMEQERVAFEKEKAELKRQCEEEKKKAEEAQQALKACESKLERAMKDVEAAQKALLAAGQKIPERQRRDDDDDKPRKKKVEEEDPIPKAREKEVREKEVVVNKGPTHTGPSQKELEEAKRQAEEAERRLKELEARLREAEQQMLKLNEDLQRVQAEADAARAEAEAAKKRGRSEQRPSQVAQSVTVASTPDTSPSRNTSPTAADSEKKPRKVVEEKSEKAPVEEREPLRDTPTRPKKFVSKPMEFIDRNVEAPRTGEYSWFSGKPVAVIEEELKRERKMRINLEEEQRKQVAQINELAKEKFKLDTECHKFEHDLDETREKLRRLIEEDESDGVSDVQIFCRWLIRRYGTLDNGFRAMDTNKSGGMDVYEFCKGLSQMGWIKIVGRRLFKILDQFEKGEIDMSDLQAVFDKFVGDVPDDAMIAATMAAAEQDMKALEKNELDVARERIRKLIVESLDLENQNKILKGHVSKAEMRNKSAKEGEVNKNMEKKAELMKDAHEKLRGEKDEMTSKMTAAMWKCREAHILQVKYMRQAETSQEELKKLNRKYDALKAMYKRNAKSGTSMHDPDDLSPDSIAAMSTALLSHFGTDLSSLSLNAESLESDGDNPQQQSRGGSPDGAMVCPKCNTALRLHAAPGVFKTLQHSASAGSLRKMMKSARSGDEIGLSDEELRAELETMARGAGAAGAAALRKRAVSLGIHEDLLCEADDAGDSNAMIELILNHKDSLDSGTERAMSPEELIDNMTDEDLLFGNPTCMAGPTSPTDKKAVTFGRTAVDSKKMAAGTYGAKADGHIEKHGRKHRWQLLFADAQDRRVGDPNFVRPGSSGMPSVGKDGMPLVGNGAVGGERWGGVILSPESMDLLEHAKQVRSHWQEAVPASELDGLRSVDLNAISRGVGTARSFGVGGAAVSGSIAGSVGGRVMMGAPRGVNAPVVNNLGSSQSFPSAAPGGGHGQNLSPPPPAFLDANNLSPPTEGAAGSEGFVPSAINRPDSSRTLLKDKSNKKRADSPPIERSTLENRNFQSGPNLEIVGNNDSPGLSKSYPSYPSGVPVGGKSPPPDDRTPAPPLTVTSAMRETGPLPDFDDVDGGVVHGHSMGGRGNSNVVGMWNAKKSFSKGELEQAMSPPVHDKALGAGLPANVDRMSPLVRGGLRQVPKGGDELPRITAARIAPKKLDQKAMMSTSMPDLGVQFERSHTGSDGRVRTPPLAAKRGEAEEGTPTHRRVRTRKVNSALERAPVGTSTAGIASARRLPSNTEGIANAAYPEAPPPPLLYVGMPPSPSQAENAMRSNTCGASHRIPGGLSMMRAGNALNLGAHVQRHAAAGDEMGSPLVVQNTEPRKLL